jgi:hypothetical protein
MDDIAERIIYGEEIGYLYFGQDAGTNEFVIYNNKKCKIAIGDILGITDKQFSKYQLSGNNIIVDKQINL